MPRPPKLKLSPRKQPRQARSQNTVSAILQAATRVLSKESLAGFNTNRVAEVAGISVGSLYQYFPNKDALVTALIVAEHQSLTHRFEELAKSLLGADAQTSLWAVVNLAIEQQFANPLFAAALDHEELRLPLKNLLAQAHQDLLISIGSVVKPHFPALGVDELEDCMIIAKALIETAADSDKLPPANLAQRVYRAIAGYLNYTDSTSGHVQSHRPAPKRRSESGVNVI